MGDTFFRRWLQVLRRKGSNWGGQFTPAVPSVVQGIGKAPCALDSAHRQNAKGPIRGLFDFLPSGYGLSNPVRRAQQRSCMPGREATIPPSPPLYGHKQLIYKEYNYL